MPLYKAFIQADPKKTATWKNESGTSAEDVEKRLRQNRQALLAIQPAERTKSRWRIKTRDKMQFFREMGNSIFQEISIHETLGDFAESISDSKAVATCQEMKKASLGGATLDKAMRAVPGAFSQTELGLVESFGKISKTYDGLNRCYDILDRADRIRRALKSALMYPSVIFVFGIVFVIFLGKGPLPVLRGVYEGKKLPPLFAVICRIVDVTINNGFFMLALVFIGGPVAVFLLRRWLRRPGTHRLLLKLPKIGSMIRIYTTTNFLRTYTALTEAELPEPEKMRMCRTLSPMYPYMEAFAWAVVRTNSGAPPHEVLNDYVSVFGKNLIGVFRRGNKSADLVKGLSASLKLMERDLDDAVKNFESLATPLALLVILPPILFIVVGVFSGVVGLMSIF